MSLPVVESTASSKRAWTGFAPTRPRLSPLVTVASAMALGILLDRFTDPCRSRVWAILAIGFAGLALVLTSRWPRLATVATLVSLLAVGGGWHHRVWSDLASNDLARVIQSEDDRRPCWIRGVLEEPGLFRPGDAEIPGDRGSTRTVLAVTEWFDGQRWIPVTGRVQVWVAADRSDLAASQPVQAAGSLSAIAGPLNPGEFDPRFLLRARGIRLRLVVSEPDAIWVDPTRTAPTGVRWLADLRAWSARTLTERIDPAVSPLALALLLGRREAVDPEVNDAFARTGTTHLLAISGLHLQLLAVALAFLARCLAISRHTTFLVIAAGTLAYAMVVGFAPSVARSTAMTLGICLAGWCDREVRTVNLLAAALLFTIAFNPTFLFDVGCQLSFLAVAVIFWCLPAVSAWEAPELNSLDHLERETEPWWKMLGRFGWTKLREGVRMSLVVWLVAWPLVALRFHLVAPVGILLNLPLIPLTSLALLMSGLTLAAGAVWEPLAAGPAWCCNGLLWLCERIVRWGVAQPWGHRFGPGPAWPLVALFYSTLIVALTASTFRFRIGRAAWWICLLIGLVLAVDPLIPTRPVDPEVELLAVGHGLACVIRSSDGRVILYDCGKMSDPHVGRRVIAPALWARGIQRIDLVLLSHADADHYNALPDLLDRFTIGELRVADGFGGRSNPGAMELLDLVRRRQVPAYFTHAGDALGFGPIRLTALHPPVTARMESSDNARSLVIALDFAGRRRLMLTGDLERDGLVDLLALQPQPSEVLLSPHHGSRVANPASLFIWADPRQILVSQRPLPSGNRDSLATMAATRKIPLFRTWEQGAIRMVWTPAGRITSGFLNAPPLAASFSLLVAMKTRPAWVTLGTIVLGLGLGFVLVAFVTIVEWGAWALVLPGSGRKTRGPSPASRSLGSPDRIEVTTKDGVRLEGDWYPSLPRSERTVLLLPGLAETRSALLDRAEILGSRGWNVATLDHRGAGGSGGTRLSFGTREADDLRLWIDLLAPQSGSDARIVVWGRSMGAATALKTAAIDRRIAALVLESPYLELRRTVKALLTQLRLPTFLAGPILARARTLAGVRLDQPPVSFTAPTVQIPILILHGREDKLVPLQQAEQLLSFFPTTAHWIFVEQAGHNDLVPSGGEELLDQVATFLDRAVPPGTS